MRNKKAIIIIVIVFIIGLVSSIYCLFSSSFKQESDINKKANVKESNVSEKTIIYDNNNKEIKDKKEKEELVSGDVLINENNKLKMGEGTEEYPQNKSKQLIQELKSYSRSVNYEKIVDTVAPLLKKYKFTKGYNNKICNMYNDANLMLSTKSASDLQKGMIAKAMRDSEMKVVGSLMLPEYSRRTLIKDKQSLSPIITGKAIVISEKTIDLDNKKNIDKEDKEKVNEIIENCDDLLSLEKIVLQLDTQYIVNAYVVKNIDDTVDIYGMYSNDKNIPYKTVAFWEKNSKNS